MKKLGDKVTVSKTVHVRGGRDVSNGSDEKRRAASPVMMISPPGKGIKTRGFNHNLH